VSRYRTWGVYLTCIGTGGAVVTALLAFLWAPAVDSESWRSPEAYRILFWHVPFAWASFLAFCLLFLGAISWYINRSENGWKMVVSGSELGLLFGLGVVISGPIWGSAEWGVPWDWADLRLNTYGLLTAVALFLVLAIRSQPDGEGTRDTIAALGLFGFALVPITAMATTWFQNRHPGTVIIDGDETGLDPQIKTLLFAGAFVFMLLFCGLALISYEIQRLRENLNSRLHLIDEGTFS